MICIDYQKQILTASEARRNADETITDLRHLFELESLIEETERLKEDRDLVERITNAPARYSFKVDVGNVPPENVEAFLREAKTRMKGATRNPLDD